jgi:hypothetical protein
MRRCCARHPDWAVLSEHLRADFPSIAPAEVVQLIADAQRITDRFRLEPADALEISELICRHQLMLLTGEIPDVAHLDPQIHRPRDADD